MEKIQAVYGPDFSGKMTADNATLSVGVDEGTFLPYDLLLGGLSACFYATYLSIAEKMQLPFDRFEITVTGEKREETPQTLKYVKLDVVITGADLECEKKYRRAIDLAGRYCSVYQTIGCVADMQTRLAVEG